MFLVMSGLEHSLAPIQLRERLSFTKVQTEDMNRQLAAQEGVCGCVLISTCNRTELYLSCTAPLDPGQLLCKLSGVEYEPYRHAFVNRTDDEAVRHLMEVAAGLRSRIWGEDQILAQVKQAIVLARQAEAADSVLETLFRAAVAAGKETRSKIRLSALPTSAAGMAVALLREKTGDLNGKKAMVIGNGEMGRLAASLLHQAGCHVWVTLRTYRHGETIVPPGCQVVPYEERFRYMDGMDLLVSATTSPHYTVSADQLAALKEPPACVVDLAIPRDIQPQAQNVPGVCLYNIDDLGSCLENRTTPPEVEDVLKARREQFYRWLNYKECMPSMESLKQALVDRIFAGREMQADMTDVELVELAVGKTVELLTGGLAEGLSSEKLALVERKIRAHTRN